MGNLAVEVVYSPADRVSCWFAMTSIDVSFDTGVADGD